MKDGVEFDRIIEDVRSEAVSSIDPKFIVDRHDLHNLAQSRRILRPGKFLAEDGPSAIAVLEAKRDTWTKKDLQHCMSYKIPLTKRKPKAKKDKHLEIKSPRDSQEKNRKAKKPPTQVKQKQRPTYRSFAQSRKADKKILKKHILAKSFVVIAAPFQLQKLKEHGTKVIGVDTTHEVSMYGHLLTTICVQDERKEGLPVAFCISKRKDTATYVRFFEQVRAAVGQINCDYFMSDGDPTIYDAWKEVMGEAKQPRLCSWHVKKAWGRKLDQLTVREETPLRNQMNRQLDKLMYELDEEK